MRIALAQINPTVGDLSGNADLIRLYAADARAKGADLVAFPELALSGHPLEDLVLKRSFLRDCQDVLRGLAKSCPDLVLLVGVPLEESGALYNAVAVLSRGGLAGWYRKISLPDCGASGQKRYFSQGDRVAVLQVAGSHLGITVSDDIWNDDGPGQVAAAVGGATILLNLSMSPYYVGKGRRREQMLSRRAREVGAYICYVNGVGGQDELVFDGQSLVFAPDGSLKARAAQFEEQLLVVEVETSCAGPLGHNLGGAETGAETDAGAKAAAAVGAGAEGGARAKAAAGVELGGETETADKDRRAGGLSRDPGAAWPVELICLPGAASCPEASLGSALPTAPVCEPLSTEAEVYKALCLAVRDYARKNGFGQVVLGISGGIDSALTACIAADALGADKVNTVFMPSRYSSEESRRDARETAQRLEVGYNEMSIDEIFEAYLKALSPPLDPSAAGVTEQNIQARIRGNLLMALSNHFGWLVVTSGNKSEIAVGYTTLYGDMVGGFGPLKDVPKTLVYRLAAYRNSLGPGDGPIPESTLSRAPSAELAPGQTDQDTLPPYEVLDKIIEAYVVQNKSVAEIAALGIEREVAQQVVAMIDKSEYKRRQAAPGVCISPKSLGRDWRLPITNRYRE